MQNAAKTTALTGNRATVVTVTSKRTELPKVTVKPSPAEASQRRNGRNSKVLRIPNELLPRVRQIVAEFRAAQCLDPDSWN